MTAFAIQNDTILLDEESDAVFVADEGGCDQCCGTIVDPDCCGVPTNCGRVEGETRSLFVGMTATGTYEYIDLDTGANTQSGICDVPKPGGTPVAVNLWPGLPLCQSPAHGLFPPSPIQTINTFDTSLRANWQAWINARWQNAAPHWASASIDLYFFHDDPDHPGYERTIATALRMGIGWSAGDGAYIVLVESGEMPDPPNDYVAITVSGACETVMDIEWDYSKITDNVSFYEEVHCSGTAQLLVNGVAPCSGGGGEGGGGVGGGAVI